MEPLTSFLEIIISTLYLNLDQWDFTIFVLALIIRVAFFPFQIFNFKQQELLEKIQPEIDNITAVLKHKPLELHTMISNLKRKHGIKSGWSMIFSLIQLPVFFSIFKVFSSMQLLLNGRLACVISLGSPDPLFILPALVAVIQFIQQKINTKAQPSFLKFMPLLSFLFMVAMPSGLVAYYLASGVLQLMGDIILRRFT